MSESKVSNVSQAESLIAKIQKIEDSFNENNIEELNELYKTASETFQNYSDKTKNTSRLATVLLSIIVGIAASTLFVETKESTTTIAFVIAACFSVLGLWIKLKADAEFSHLNKTIIERLFTIQIESLKAREISLQKTTVPDHIIEVANISPANAVFESWKELEETATASTAITHPSSLFEIAGTLIERGKLNESQAHTFYKLGELEKEIHTSGDKAVTYVSSLSYGELAHSLAETIKNKET